MESFVVEVDRLALFGDERAVVDSAHRVEIGECEDSCVEKVWFQERAMPRGPCALFLQKILLLCSASTSPPIFPSYHQHQNHRNAIAQLALMRAAQSGKHYIAPRGGVIQQLDVITRAVSLQASPQDRTHSEHLEPLMAER